MQLSPSPIPLCHSNHLTSHFHPPPPHGSRYTRTSLPALFTPCLFHQPHSCAPHLHALSALPSPLSFRLFHSHICPCHALPTSLTHILPTPPPIMQPASCSPTLVPTSPHLLCAGWHVPMGCAPIPWHTAVGDATCSRRVAVRIFSSGPANA